MNRFDRIARGMLRPINPYSTLILGLFTALWGLWVITPEWSVFEHAALFSKMGAFAPEWAWGLWAFVAGTLVVLSVFKGMYRPLSWALAFLVWHWTTVGVFMWWGDWQNTGGLTYSFVAFYCAYAYLNIKINYVRYSDSIQHFDQ